MLGIQELGGAAAAIDPENAAVDEARNVEKRPVLRNRVVRKTERGVGENFVDNGDGGAGRFQACEIERHRRQTRHGLEEEMAGGEVGSRQRNGNVQSQRSRFFRFGRK